MKVQTDVALAEWCTLGIGGPARWFQRATDESALQAALAWARDRNVRVHVLGGGSNVVFADEGFDGLVLQVDVRGLEQQSIGHRRVWVVGAGEPWDEFVAMMVDEGAAGLECLSGIPGLVGGTPVQNVGAYGQDVSGVIRAVHAIDRSTNATVALDTRSCAFGYRTSRFKREGGFIVSRVEFALRHGDPPTITYADVVSHFERLGPAKPTLKDVREVVLAIRRRKGMVIEPSNAANRSVGSFFVNPVITREHFARIEAGDTSIPHYPMGASQVKVPAAWLIERAGFPRGFSRGGIGVSPFQAQAIINQGGASAADVIALATDIKRAVWNTFSISLVPEPVFVGFPPSPELRWLIESPSQGGESVRAIRG